MASGGEELDSGYRFESMDSEFHSALDYEFNETDDGISQQLLGNLQNQKTRSGNDEILRSPYRDERMLTQQVKPEPQHSSYQAYQIPADVVLDDQFEMEDISDGSFSLQEIVDKLLKEPDWPPNAVHVLKNGICINWIKNNFNCKVGKYCKYAHDAATFFKKKLKSLPSGFIVRLIVAMKDDIFFKDMLMESFDVLTHRKNSERYLPLVCFIPFYLKDLNDADLIEFWDKAAEYFMLQVGGTDKIDGIAHLLKIYRLIDESRQMKLINFLVVLRNFGVTITWKLLEPVIEFKIPIVLLLEAVSWCNKLNVDVEEVYEQIISRIVIKDLPIEGVEILLQFCETLAGFAKSDEGIFLKYRLRFQVLNLASEIDENRTPRSYLYYRELATSVITREQIDEEQERKVDDLLKRDEERLKTRPFSPPPHCQFDNSFFMSHCSLPSKLENRPRPSAKLRKKKIYLERSLDFDEHIINVIEQIQTHQFTVAGKSFNRFHRDRCVDAAKRILDTILKMKISPEEIIKFFKQVVLTCESKNSVIIISSIAMTFIYLYLNIEEPQWEFAYQILKTCDEQDTDLSYGAVISMKEDGKESLLSRPQKILLLLEICFFNGKIEDAQKIISKFNLWNAAGCSHLNFNEAENKSRENFVQQLLKGQAGPEVKVKI